MEFYIEIRIHSNRITYENPRFVHMLRSAYAESEINEIARLGRGSAWTISLHPDGTLLAVGRSASIWIFDKNYQQLEHYPALPVRRVEFNPDENYLMVFRLFRILMLLANP